MRARAEFAFNRTWLDIFGQVAPGEVNSVFQVPNDVGGGVLVVGSEDLFATWTLEERRQEGELLSYRRTGPASRDVFYVERGGRLSVQVHQVVPHGHVDQITGLITGNGNIPLVASEPRLFARFYPMNRPEFEPGHSRGGWTRFLPTFETAQEGINVIFSLSVLSEHGQMAAGLQSYGYAVAFTRHFHLGISANAIAVRVVDPVNNQGLANFGGVSNVFEGFAGTWGRLQVNNALVRDAFLLWSRQT